MQDAPYDRALALAAEVRTMRDHFLDVRCGGCGAGRVLSLGQMAKDRRLATATLAHVALRITCHGCHDGPTRISLTATGVGTEPPPHGAGVLWAVLLVERSDEGAFRRRDGRFTQEQVVGQLRCQSCHAAPIRIHAGNGDPFVKRPLKVVLLEGMRDQR